MDKILTVNCPRCGVSVVWRSDNIFRPFCSQRCRDADFIAWANEEHVISEESDFDDAWSEQFDGDEG